MNRLKTPASKNIARIFHGKGYALKYWYSTSGQWISYVNSSPLIEYLSQHSCYHSLHSWKNCLPFLCLELPSNIEYELLIIEYIRIVPLVEYSNSNVFEYGDLFEYGAFLVAARWTSSRRARHGKIL
ncbi:hypothetical protein Y032_0656g1224 [Ancylostoma ceylanicum]|uniref:Uncharacterized protein n=1 Tax=Ancylostoma ceylanicum TaxID=53326 RepID=A0A016WI10_9BILA|nr:hypothetical protein Y032_0656g1224 [Ancylostoma ceylanicum]